LKLPLKRLSPSKTIPRRESMSKKNTKQKPKSGLLIHFQQALLLTASVLRRIKEKQAKKGSEA